MSEPRSRASERAAARVIRWTELYTAGLPADVRSERLDEVRSDLHEQLASKATGRVTDRASARSIRARSIRGTLADVSWRRAEVRRLPHRGGTIAARALLALVIAVAAATSTVLFLGSGSDTSNASLAKVQVESLRDQVHGEALFLVPFVTSVQYDTKYLASDPNYRLVLPGEKEGALAEYNIYRALLSQLASEQRSAERASASASRRSAEGTWVTGFAAAALALLAFVLWFEPRSTRAQRDQTAKS